MKRPLYIYIFPPSLARLRKFRGIWGFCATLTKPRLLSPPGQLAGGCLQTGFFTCEPQHAPETNFKSGGRPGLPAGGGKRPAPGGASLLEHQVLASAQPYPPGSDGSACERATEPSGDRPGRDGTVQNHTEAVPGVRAAGEPGGAPGSRAARPARASSGHRERAGGGCAGLGWPPLTAGARRL